MIPHPPRGAAAMSYVRSAQLGQGARCSLTQYAACRRLIADSGYVDLGGRGDEGASGRTLERPGLQALLGLAQAGAYEVLVTTSLDRLSRDVAALHWIVTVLTDCGVTLVTLEEGVVQGPSQGLTKLQRHAATPIATPGNL